jgi:thioesterase domain-containing protein
MKRWFPPASDGREIDPIMANADRVFASYLRAQSRYFTMPYGGNILLFRAKRAGVGFYAAGRTLGWGTHVGGRVDVHEIDANHDSIVLKPGIDRVAEVIDRRLNDVDEAQAVHAGERGDAAVTAA